MTIGGLNFAPTLRVKRELKDVIILRYIIERLLCGIILLLSL